MSMNQIKIYGAHNAGIFPVLYEGKTEEKNSFEGQNEGDEILA